MVSFVLLVVLLVVEYRRRSESPRVRLADFYLPKRLTVRVMNAQVIRRMTRKRARQTINGSKRLVSGVAEMTLVWPSRKYLPSYIAALERGWSPDNLRGKVVARVELARIGADADAFIASLVDREAVGDPITLPDGTKVPRLPGYRRWMWDGEFCGSIGLRWQRGTEALPPYCLGHIGYGVVPWKQRRGYATRALREVLGEAKAEGLRFVEITTDPDNVASRRVVEANGGVIVERFVTPSFLGAESKLRYRVQLHGGA